MLLHPIYRPHRHRHRFLWLGLLTGALVLAVRIPANCEFYRYLDRDGHAHYVDDIGKIPEQYIDQVDRYQEKYDHLPAEKRAEAITNERRTVETRTFPEETEAMQPSQFGVSMNPPRALPASRPSSEDDRLETPVTIAGNHVLVPARLESNGNIIEVKLLLDTGASMTMLHRAVADRMELRSEKKGAAMLVGGKRIRTGMARLDYVRIGPLKVHDTWVSILPHRGPPVPFDGLLGMDVLRHVQYSIDFRKQVIRWIR